MGWASLISECIETPRQMQMTEDLKPYNMPGCIKPHRGDILVAPGAARGLWYFRDFHVPQVISIDLLAYWHVTANARSRHTNVCVRNRCTQNKSSVTHLQRLIIFYRYFVRQPADLSREQRGSLIEDLFHGFESPIHIDALS